MAAIVNLDENLEVYHIMQSRSKPRDPESGSICFDVIYIDGSLSRVKIQDFIDLDDNTFLYDEVTTAVNDWIRVAETFPHTRRQCLLCRRRSMIGEVLCKRCKPVWGPAVYAIDEDDEP